MRALSSLVDRVRRSKWMPLLAKIVASFGVIAALGLVGTGIADGWIRTRRATAAGSLSSSSSAASSVSAPGRAASDATSALPPASPASAHASATSTARGEERGAAPCVVEGKVVLNTATAEELDKLPGIGLSKAQRIVELRTKLGKFTRLEELYRIKGIKRRLLDKLRPLVVLDPPADCPS